MSGSRRDQAVATSSWVSSSSPACSRWVEIGYRPLPESGGKPVGAVMRYGNWRELLADHIGVPAQQYQAVPGDPAHLGDAGR
jgi:hypothetical protein